MFRLPFSNRVYIPSIRTTLAVLVVGCIVPISVFTAFLMFDFYARGQAQSTASAISRARAIASGIDREIAATQAALNALGTSELLEAGDLRGFHTQAVDARQAMQVENIVLIDPSGQLLLSTGRPYGESLPRLSNPPLLSRTLTTGKPGVSNLFLGPVTGKLIYTIAVPVRRDKSIVYSLNATVAPELLLDVLSRQKLPSSWRVVITDSSGTIVARTHDMEKFVGRKVTPDLLNRMSLKTEDGFESKTLEGIPVFTSFSRSPVNNWVVAIGMPLDEVTAGLRNALHWLIVATAAALAVALTCAWIVGGRIARSITALVEPARALGAGDLVAIPELNFREATQLRQNFLDTGSALQLAQYEAHHDALTGLENRALFHNMVDRQLSLCRRNGTALAILYIDLDGFKAVNDIQGHATGDLLLQAVALRIKGAIRDSDIASRLGGDEFAIALVDSNMDRAKVFAASLIETLSAPYPLGQNSAIISASIGISVFPASASDLNTLIQAADHAMYRAKELGKGRVCVAGT